MELEGARQKLERENELLLLGLGRAEGEEKRPTSRAGQLAAAGRVEVGCTGHDKARFGDDDKLIEQLNSQHVASQRRVIELEATVAALRQVSEL